MLVNRSCPCGSGQPLSACCGIYLGHEAAPPTAEALMRSRYTAFVLRNADYLLATWDPLHRPRHIDLTKDQPEWLGLEILRTESGKADDCAGQVEFIARFRLHGAEQTLHERSRFRKQDKGWVYVDGDILTHTERNVSDSLGTQRNIGRNAPCPCGSGQKYKRCCGG